MNHVDLKAVGLVLWNLGSWSLHAQFHGQKPTWITQGRPLSSVQVSLWESSSCAHSGFYCFGLHLSSHLFMLMYRVYCWPTCIHPHSVLFLFFCQSGWGHGHTFSPEFDFLLNFAATIASYFIVAEQTILECSRKASYAASVERKQAAARSEAAWTFLPSCHKGLHLDRCPLVPSSCWIVVVQPVLAIKLGYVVSMVLYYRHILQTLKLWLLIVSCTFIKKCTIALGNVSELFHSELKIPFSTCWVWSTIAPSPFRNDSYGSWSLVNYGLYPYVYYRMCLN
jgi:hypothetical protein